MESKAEVDSRVEAVWDAGGEQEEEAGGMARMARTARTACLGVEGCRQ